MLADATDCYIRLSLSEEAGKFLPWYELSGYCKEEGEHSNKPSSLQQDLYFSAIYNLYSVSKKQRCVNRVTDRTEDCGVV